MSHLRDTSTSRTFYRLIVVPLILALLLQLWPVPLVLSLPSGLENPWPIPSLGQPEPQNLTLLGPPAAFAQTPALEISKSAPAFVNQGELLLYTLHITNTGDAEAAGVVVTDTIPSLGTYTIYAPPQDGAVGVTANSSGDWFYGHVSGTDYIRWLTADAFIPGASGLPAGGTATLYFYVRVVEPVPDQTLIINSDYIARAESIDPITGNSTETRVNAPDWAIGKTVSSATVQPGEYLTYTITASNDGHLAASGLYTITDEIPENTTLVSYSAPGTPTGNAVTWAFSETLGISAGRVVSYVVQVSEPLTDGISIINDTYSVRGANVYTGAIGSPVTTTVQAPVLNVTKTDQRDTIWPGGTLTYTLSYSNSGSASATGVVLTDTLDGNTSFVASVPPPSGGPASAPYWSLGYLPAGSSGSILITVTVASPLMSGTTLTNTATIASSQGYSDEAIDTTTVLGTPVLNLVKEASAGVIEPGELITYTISYSNSGDAPAIGVKITDTIDANTIFQSATPGYNGNYVWDFPLLWPSATHQITVTVRVADSLPNGTILTNDAIIGATGNITDADQALVTVQSAPILHLAKQASQPIINPGDILTYTIWYSNTGNAPATGVVITDDLPAELYLWSANPVPSGGDDQQQTWNISGVPVGGPYSITLVVTSENVIGDLTPLTNRVTMSSVETTTLATDKTVTVYAVELDVDKTATPGTVQANEVVAYTVTVANTGHAAAEQVRITDTLPISIVQSSVISSASPGVQLDGVATSPPDYVWTSPTLAGGSSITISLSGRLLQSPWPSTGAWLTNTVIAASDQLEIDTTNNTTSVMNLGVPNDPYTLILTPSLTETTVGTNVSVTAEVRDEYGNPVLDGTAVGFSSSPVGSGVSPSSATTTNGMANTTLSSVVSATVTVTGTAGTASDSAQVLFRPGPLHHFAIQVASPQTAGVAFTAVITALDQYGNVVDFNGSVALADATGSLTPNSATLLNGQGTQSVTVYTATPADTITATWGTGPVITGVSNSFSVLPGAPVRLTVAVAPTSLRVCQTASVSTTVADQWGNLLPNQSVNLSLVPMGGSGTLSPSSGSTGATGIFASTLSATGAGSLRIYGEASGGTPNNGATMPLIAISQPAIPATLNLDVAPNPLYTGGATAVVTATVTDCLGQSAGQVVTFTVSNPSLAWFPGPSGTYTATTDATGVATATLTSNSTPASGLVGLTAEVEGLSDNTILYVEVPPTPLLTIAKQANPPTGNVRFGQTITYTLIARNLGQGEATGVVISDTLPGGVGMVSRTTSAGTITSDTPLNVTAASLPGGGIVTVTVQVTVTEGVSGTMLYNQASVVSNETAPEFSSMVSHRVITSTGSKVFLPIIFNNWSDTSQPGPTNANLIIESIDFVGGAPAQDGDRYHVQVVVRNIGTESVTQDFWVDLYLNPVSTPTPNQPWQSLSGSGSDGVILCPYDATCYGRAWYVTTDLGPGGTVTLSTQMPPDQRYDRWPAEGVPYVESRHNPIVALVDSWGNSYGAVYENDETDNLSTPISGAGAALAGPGIAPPTLAPGSAGGTRPTLPTR